MYIILWNYCELPENGGGTYHKICKEKDLEFTVNNILSDPKNLLIFCGEINKEVKFKFFEKWKVEEWITNK